MPLRFPAEWEPQSAVLLAWPHSGTDWALRLTQVEDTYRHLVAAISARQQVLICVADQQVAEHASACVRSSAARLERVRWVQVGYDDTWLRDSGPISLVPGGPEEAFELLDFRFTGWGGKYQATRDDALVAALCAAGVFSHARPRRVDFALEGGAIETDGAGTLLTTWRCLHERHPQLDRAGIEAELKLRLRQERVLWLDRGYLEGDDTDAHIDTLARFCDPRTIVYQGCDDPDDPHFEELGAMAAELAALRDVDGKPYRCIALPWARPILDEGRRLAASYANFLIINGAVLMPAYDDPADVHAARVLQSAFPDREIVPIPCRALIWQNGSLHCISMQLPRGLVDG
jgi:agmatine/peptidylarginine deiminase